jgi:hypothetical protein
MKIASQFRTMRILCCPAKLHIVAVKELPALPSASLRSMIERTQMKTPVVNPLEHKCPERMGTGFTMAEHPTRPGVRIYQECKECRGKGRVTAN